VAMARACAPVIQRLCPLASAIAPSSVSASLSVTWGARPWCAAGTRRAPRAQAGRGRDRWRSRPCAAAPAQPRRARIGVCCPATTRAGRAATSRSAQLGPRGEAWAQGSRLT
jgi:hypothetical protein